MAREWFPKGEEVTFCLEKIGMGAGERRADRTGLIFAEDSERVGLF
ncbi:MAG: hypothetical protein KJ804_17860 [Proteobacteria bacterium]|nr:hypothetical protein [Pseudomonadota bacterium]MBU1060175.1 hypothetical protein [Pseudomonadota bacterium]